MNRTGRHSKKRKRKMVKKSRYYRERQLRILYIGIGAGILLLILIVKERIEGGANEKAVLRIFINCPFVCINFDFFWLNKARQLYMDF